MVMFRFDIATFDNFYYSYYKDKNVPFYGNA